MSKNVCAQRRRFLRMQKQLCFTLCEVSDVIVNALNGVCQLYCKCWRNTYNCNYIKHQVG